MPVVSKINAILTFLSSGTTSNSDGRSKSSFSADGVTMYRGNSLLAFSEMLKFRSGHTEFGGVSLVPPVSEWSDSSLARMIHWLGEFWDITYADYLDFADVERAIKTSGSSETRPVFVFATAFHLIDFLDQHPGRICRLPPGSMVIETGGTKGRTRSVTRPELYSLIATGFGITQDQIVSEYGMCELASQAYDVVQAGTSKTLEERRFRFPDWAPVRVMRDAHHAIQEGEGALLIWDRARLDIAAPIQVEDLVKLDGDGSFQLLGRIPTAPLKGCSLKVEDILGENAASASVPSNAIPKVTPVNIEDLLPRAVDVVSWLHTLANDPQFASRLVDEFGSKTIAAQAIQDFKKSIPNNATALAEAATNALNGKTELPYSWVVIPPSTHSFATVQPIALLLTLGRNVQLRLTTLMGQQEHGSSLERMYELLKETNLAVSSLPSTWRLKSQADMGAAAVLVFGDDATISTISQITAGPVTGFGNAVAATLTYAYELENDAIVEKVVRDNIALSQRGCMSSRINFIIGEIHPSLVARLIAQFELMLCDKRPPALGAYVARSLEIVRLEQIGGTVYRLNSTDGLACVFKAKNFDSLAHISKQEMNFLFQEVSEDAIELRLALKDLKKISVSDSAHSFLNNSQILNLYTTDCVPLGLLNTTPLNGLHFGVPIFL